MNIQTLIKFLALGGLVACAREEELKIVRESIDFEKLELAMEVVAMELAPLMDNPEDTAKALTAAVLEMYPEAAKQPSVG